MVALPGGIFQINAVLLIPVNCTAGHPEGNAKRPGGCHLGVGQQRILQLMLSSALAKLCRPVRAHRDELVAELNKLRLDFLQLTQLQVTVGSPPTSIEDQYRRFLEDSRIQIESAPIGGG